jgi:aryl-alcohol dehydrogenase-like predicted oxidoreductase
VSTVITGASKAEQVKENMKAIDLLPALNDEIMSKIETILDNKPEALSDYR